MKGPDIIREKSIEFAILIIKCTSRIAKEKQEYIISKQLLKSGTSIGANVSEAAFAQSKPDFIHKLSIALKESNESKYWLKLLQQTNFLNSTEIESMMGLNEDLIRLISKSIKTAKENLESTK